MSMSIYNTEAVDLYMRRSLEGELQKHEADNALTALTTLTVTYPSLFPFESTFVELDYQPGKIEAVGIKFSVYGEDSVTRELRIPRADLADIGSCIKSVLHVLREFVRVADGRW
jgi:hypothetical protein